MKTGQPTSEQTIPAVVAHILRGRGVAEADMARFVWPDYERDQHDPWLLTDMVVAVDRLEQAAAAGERVVVYGDYDIDGMTATAIMMEGLAAIGIRATSYIPDRFEEGYGLNVEAIQALAAAGTGLIITVDCGITSVAEAARARELGMDMIITDHHSPPEVLPQAVSVINPKRPGDKYPFKELCGAGVAFKVVRALQSRTGKPLAGQEKWLLDLVALGTVCDVVDLVDENRMLVSFGLRVLRQTRRPGIAALAAVAGTTAGELSAYHLGYVLGPRLNAAGRLEHANTALELLQTTDADRAYELAAVLDELNQRRRAEQDAAFEEAKVMANTFTSDPVLVLVDEDWSHGIVGIVASKLVEEYHKPVLVAQILGEHIKGSARSIGSFNMVEALRANDELLVKFGGHYFAAGYTLATNNLVALRAGLVSYYRASGSTSNGPAELKSELNITDINDVSFTTYNELKLLEPHGAGNPAPLVSLDGLSLGEVGTVGATKRHLKARLVSGSQSLGGIGFGLGHLAPGLSLGQTVRVVGKLDVNTFRGQSSLQLVMSGITPYV